MYEMGEGQGDSGGYHPCLSLPVAIDVVSEVTAMDVDQL